MNIQVMHLRAKTLSHFTILGVCYALEEAIPWTVRQMSLGAFPAREER